MYSNCIFHAQSNDLYIDTMNEKKKKVITESHHTLIKSHPNFNIGCTNYNFFAVQISKSVIVSLLQTPMAPLHLSPKI